MSTATIEIPDSAVRELDAYKDRLGEVLMLGLSQMRVHEALFLYARGAVSFGRAAELSKMSETELTRHARAFGVSPIWSEVQAAEELS